ncbi:hypothetical protein HanRHA438_Chr04g0153101 [Helianthus annuus]|nr:hypothetical protein HanRHA438_Chr04g0153101 [Helianthus annuus]
MSRVQHPRTLVGQPLTHRRHHRRRRRRRRLYKHEEILGFGHQTSLGLYQNLEIFLTHLRKSHLGIWVLRVWKKD